MPFSFPKIYPILDSARIPHEGRGEFLRRLGGDLYQSGVTLFEYRNKTGSDAELLADAEILRAAMPAEKVKLILDDRADLVKKIGFDGAHVDAGDLSPTEARALLGPEAIIGTFGGAEALLPGILAVPASYYSVGPVFATTTKEVTRATIGIEGVRRLRAEAGPKPVLVAVAGVTLETAPALFEAGASVVAVAAALFSQPDPAAEFRRWMQALA